MASVLFVGRLTLVMTIMTLYVAFLRPTWDGSRTQLCVATHSLISPDVNHVYRACQYPLHQICAARQSLTTSAHQLPLSPLESTLTMLRIVLVSHVEQRCITFLGQGPQRIIFSALEGQRQNYELRFQESSIKKSIFKNLTSLFIDYSLIFLPSELLRIVISCKIVNSSMTFKFIHKFFLIQEKFLVFFKLLRGSDITRSGAGSGPRVVHPCSNQSAMLS